MKILDHPQEDDGDEPPQKKNNQDPEEYFANKKEKIQSGAEYFHEEWNRKNPNQPYGGNTFNY